jgi:hypothetical protein
MAIEHNANHNTEESERHCETEKDFSDSRPLKILTKSGQLTTFPELRRSRLQITKSCQYD